MLKVRVIFITLLLSVCVFPARAQVQPHPTVPQDLSGYWRFALDRSDEGVTRQWFNVRLQGFIKLPGILQAQNQGEEITTKTPWVLSLYDRFWYLREDYKDYTERIVKVPFLSQPPRHYLGVAWYQTDISIPSNWVGRRVVLTLERPHWETTVWLDSKKIGSERSLVAPHVFDFGTVTPGRHQLTIRVDNRMIMPYRPDAHSVSDSLAASWNGITGKIQLSSTGRVWIEDAQVFPQLASKTMLIKVRIGNQTGLSGSGTLTAVWPDVGVVPVTWDENGGTAEVEVPIRQEAVKWDEFHPTIYPLRLWLSGNGVNENLELKIGLREFKAEGKEFQLNGHPIIFRGTHHGGDFPLTGYPPTDVASWKKLFELCRTWGLNHMRFHSWCPPEAAFEAADSLGFYLQPEPGMWNEISPDTPMERMLYEETERMIKAYGNHPSFMLLSASNEPKGDWQPALAKWADYFRKKDPRRLYTRGTGHTERQIENVTEGSDYLAIQRIGPKMLRRESGWFGGDYNDALENINIPVISHEIGQWCAYPDFDVIKKFTGFMKPGNFEIFRDSLKAHGLLEKNKSFADASGRFQVAVYKEEIEANLRTRGLSGFQLLDLHDYLGQGTALVGLLDPFWEPKGYVKAEEFTDFCNTTVPLARFPKYVYTDAERLEVPVEVAHYGAEPMEDGKGVWRIDDNLVGEWDAKTITIGKNIQLGNISVALAKVGPGEHKLTVTLAPSTFFAPITRRIIPRAGVVRGSTYFENSWTFFVYPPAEVTAHASTDPALGSLCEKSRDTDVLITSSWDEAEKKLAMGGKVLFSPRSNDLDWSSPPLDIVPIFWNRQMMPAWGRMLGLWIKKNSGRTKDHMIDGFLTSDHFDWQWAEIIRGARAINIDRLPEELEPVVWAIDDWNRNYKLGLLFEAGIGNGKLLVSAIDVNRENDTNPVLAQLRRSLLTYMKGDCFQPSVGVTPREIRSLLFDTRIMAKLGAKAEVEGASAAAAIDGDPTTYVLVGDQRAPAREQVELQISFREPVAMSGVVLMGRQNHREHEGDIREFVIQASDDGKAWSDIARGELPSAWGPQRVEFSRVNTARYLKLISLSGFGTDKTTALAEIAVIKATKAHKAQKAHMKKIDRRSFVKSTGVGLVGMSLFPLGTKAQTEGGRRVYPLNRKWLFSEKNLPAGTALRFDDSRFARVTIPHTNKMLPWHGFDDKDYQFVSLYRRHFQLPAGANGKRVFVDFGGVMTAATVHINGHRVGEYRGGYTPFSYELTQFVNWRGDNVIAVEVDSTERKDIPPFGGEIDYLTFGGIYRDVALRVVPQTFIENVFAKPLDVLGSGRCLQVRCFLENNAASRKVKVELLDGARVVDAKDADAPSGSSNVDVTLTNLGSIQLWEPDHPKLYDVRVTLLESDRSVDEYTTRTGFREARFTPDGFFLNGKHLKLRGLNRHQTFPFVGQAMPARVQKRDAWILKKELKCNIVRTSHYPQSPHFLDACDEYGLLVLEEIPGWQHIGDQQWKDLSVSYVEKMVRRDWNHPSIVLWGVRVNESRDDHDFYTRTNQLAHSLDDSRQTGGIRYNYESELLEDVFTMNDFQIPLRPPKHQLYLNTEFIGHMYPTKRNDNVERVTEHTMRHARVHNQLASDKRYAGGIGWCAFDYNTHANFCSTDRICYHGVGDIFRIPKPAGGFYKSQCDPAEEIVLEPAFDWSRGDRNESFNIAMVSSNCEHLKIYIGKNLVADIEPDRENFPHLKYPPFVTNIRAGINKGWGDLTLEGYIGGKLVITKKLSGQGADRQFHMEADDRELNGDGIDATRVVLKVTDEYGAVRPLANAAISLTLTGPGQIIGDNPFALFGGVGAIWIKARETAGLIRLTARHPYLGEKTVDITVKPQHPEIL